MVVLVVEMVARGSVIPVLTLRLRTVMCIITKVNNLILEIKLVRAKLVQLFLPCQKGGDICTSSCINACYLYVVL